MDWKQQQAKLDIAAMLERSTKMPKVEDTKETTIGNNVAASVAQGKLTIVVDLTTTGKPSRTGASEVLASTLGNKIVTMREGKPVSLGLNVYTPRS